MPITADTRLTLLSFDDVMREELPPIDWLVEQIVAKKDRVIVYGEYASYKSWLLLHLGLHMAVGRKWLGEFEVPVAKKVLYIDEEMNERTLRRRIKQLATGAGLEARGVEFHALSHAGITFDEEGARNLLGALGTSGFNPDVIIVEALRRVLKGSENSSEDMSAFWRRVEPIVQADKALIISHHMRKPSGRPGPDPSRYRASGSTDILAGADTGFAIEKEDRRLFTVECVKSRNVEEPKTFAVRFHCEREDSPVELRFDGYRSGSENQTTEKQRAMGVIYLYFNMLGPCDVATPNELRERVSEEGITGRTFERAWKAVKQSGKVEKAGGRTWRLKEEYRFDAAA